MTDLDPRRRFSVTAGLYEKYRPTYPAEIIDWLVAEAGLLAGAQVVDVGCGTGIATRLFAARGFNVIGVDPNEEMLTKAKALGGARYERGDAAATGLQNGAADLIFAAQAFHWFAIEPTLREWRRVLRSGGSGAA